MKTLVSAVLIVICCLCHHSAGSIATEILMTTGCCESNTTVRVPVKRITYMGMTPNHCRPKSVIIKTVRDREICVDPEEQWVKKALLEFQKLTANNKPPSGPFNSSKCRKKH